jgi:hypothetical protein
LYVYLSGDGSFFTNCRWLQFEFKTLNMQTKKTSLLFFAFLICLSCLSQKIIINGQETNRKLNWPDFTGKVDTSSPFFAYTHYNIKSKLGNIRIIGDSVNIGNFEVTLELDPNKSWAKNDKVTSELLIHEQGHFNLGILAMKEILDRFKESKFTRSNYNTELQNIVNDALKKYNNMSVQYDEETNHSKNKQEQMKWNDFFSKNLPKQL